MGSHNISMAAKAEESTVVVTIDDEGIGVIRFNRPSKYNAFREEDTAKVNAASVKPQLLSTVKAHITEYNESVFDSYLSFPKPLFAAVNGPAVGMGVTTASLTDCIVASSTATFHTPFMALGLPAEGCSSYNFARLMGEQNAAAMIDRGDKVDADTALAYGLVARVVPPEELLETTKQVARKWLAAGKGRPLLEHEGLLQHMKSVNARESAALGEAVTSRNFFEIQMKNAQAKGNNSVSWMFWLMAQMHPIL